MRNFSYAVLGLFLFIIGCNIQDLEFDKLKVENLQSDVAVPFGTASYTLRELIDDIADDELDLEEDSETAELRLTYYDTASYTFDPSIFNVPNVSNESTVGLPEVAVSGAVVVLDPNPQTFYQVYESANEEIIDSVLHADNSNLSIFVESNNAVNISYDMTLTNTTNVGTGLPLTFSGTLADGSTVSHNQNLMNHMTTFTEESGENRFNVDIDITSITIDAGESIAAGDELTITIAFEDQEFIIAYGKMGQDTVDIAGERLNVGFFDDFGLEGLDFGNPEINFDFRSSFGLPIGLGLSKVYGEESDGTQTFLTGSAVDTPPVISGASTEHPVSGERVQSLITIDAQNSSLQELLATSPSTIGFDVQGFTNPYDDTALNFVTDTSTIKSYIEMTMPLEVRMTDLTHSLDFDIAGGVNFSQADSLALRVMTVNELPFAATMDIYILDAAEDTLYTALSSKALDIPFLNIDRTVREPKTSIDDVPFGPEGIDALNNGDKIRVVLTMNTPESLTSENIFVKLLATAKLDVTLAARGIIDVDL